MSANVNLNGVQNKVKENARRARRRTHRMALATLGVAGLTYDAGMSIFHRAGNYAHVAEERGQVIEAAFNERASQVQEQMAEEAKAQRAKVGGAVSSISGGVGDTGKAIEQQFQSKLSSLKIGSGTIVETDQIKIEVEVIDNEPWEGYDALNAQEIIDELPEMDPEKLQEAYDYEASTKNRVTVLREIEMLQAAMDEEETSSTTADATTEEQPATS